MDFKSTELILANQKQDQYKEFNQNFDFIVPQFNKFQIGIPAFMMLQDINIEIEFSKQDKDKNDKE